MPQFVLALCLGVGLLHTLGYAQLIGAANRDQRRDRSRKHQVNAHPERDFHVRQSILPFCCSVKFGDDRVARRGCLLKWQSFAVAGHILEAVWGHSAELNMRTVDTHVSRIRARFELTPVNGWRMSAVYPRGCRLDRVAAAAQQGMSRTGCAYAPG